MPNSTFAITRNRRWLEGVGITLTTIEITIMREGQKTNRDAAEAKVPANATNQRADAAAFRQDAA